MVWLPAGSCCENTVHIRYLRFEKVSLLPFGIRFLCWSIFDTYPFWYPALLSCYFSGGIHVSLILVTFLYPVGIHVTAGGINSWFPNGEFNLCILFIQCNKMP